MTKYIPAVPKYNLDKIFTRTLISVVFVAVIAAIVAQILYKKEDNLGKLVINGPHCKVPDFKPTSLKNLKVKKTKRLKPCHSVKKQQRSLTAIMSSTRVEDPLFIKIHEKHFSDYGVSNASCCYHTTKREKNSDMKIKLHGECKEFQNNHEIDKKYQTLFIQCSSGGKVIYSNVHAIITQKQEFVDRQEETEIDPFKAYKVLLVGFDSISRMNFPRGMPNTYNLFHGKKEWIEMKGYTRLGNETFLNLFAVLTGRSPTERYGRCNPLENTFLDDCNFIWNDYERAGYVTAYAEDQKNRSTFHLRHQGFKKQPTDHYFRPFVIVAEDKLKVNFTNGLAYCLSTTLYIEHIFVYAMKMISIHEPDPFFGLFYVNSLSDKQLSSAPPLDNKLSHSFLKSIDDIDDMIVVYFSDSGLRFEENENGFYEERSPFLAIRLPLPFQRNYPEITRNLKLNANRLTTPYDLYATLRHIINLSTDAKLETEALGCRMCKSLFSEIPIERQCSDVNIPHDSCPCSLIKLNGSEEVVQFAARHSVEILNNNLEKRKTENGERCANLKLIKVSSVYQQLTSPWHIQYIIQFEVSPSKARFEALLERKMKTLVFESPQFELMQAIVPLNNEPYCIPNLLSEARS